MHHCSIREPGMHKLHDQFYEGHYQYTFMRAGSASSKTFSLHEDAYFERRFDGVSLQDKSGCNEILGARGEWKRIV